MVPKGSPKPQSAASRAGANMARSYFSGAIYSKAMKPPALRTLPSIGAPARYGRSLNPLASFRRGNGVKRP